MSFSTLVNFLSTLGKNFEIAFSLSMNLGIIESTKSTNSYVVKVEALLRKDLAIYSDVM